MIDIARVNSAHRSVKIDFYLSSKSKFTEHIDGLLELYLLSDFRIRSCYVVNTLENVNQFSKESSNSRSCLGILGLLLKYVFLRIFKSFLIHNACYLIVF